ncbi:MAG TPA: hypothetical protein VGD60_05785 [Candidatus Acidoferrales bacterium]
MKASAALFLALVSATFGATGARSQWIPILAKIRSTVEITRNGTTTKTLQTGIFFRSSDGSTMTTWDKNDAGDVIGELMDNKKLHLCVINYTKGTLIPVRTCFKGPVTSEEILRARNSLLGDDFVDGVRCRRSATFIDWPGQEPERVGETCTSLDYVLEIRHDYTSTRNSVTTHDLTEIYNIVVPRQSHPRRSDISSLHPLIQP